MAIHQKLQAKLSQKLILTPSLQQAIKLLPMSTLELADMLNQEVVENPLLEEIPSEDLQAAEAQPATDKADEQDAQRTEGKADNWEDNDYEYFFSEYLDDGYRSRGISALRTALRMARSTQSAAMAPSRLSSPGEPALPVANAKSVSPSCKVSGLIARARPWCASEAS